MLVRPTERPRNRGKLGPRRRDQDPSLRRMLRPHGRFARFDPGEQLLSLARVELSESHRLEIRN